MATPNLTIAVEPIERGTAVYLPPAPAESTRKRIAKVVLRLDNGTARDPFEDHGRRLLVVEFLDCR